MLCVLAARVQHSSVAGATVWHHSVSKARSWKQGRGVTDAEEKTACRASRASLTAGILPCSVANGRAGARSCSNLILVSQKVSVHRLPQ